MDVLTPQYLDVRALESEYLVPGGRGHDHLIWDHAQGSHVWDVNGRELIDFSSGVLVTSIGHSHPRVTRAITEQAGRLLNCYDAPHPLRNVSCVWREQTLNLPLYSRLDLRL
jgi:4-aminobutyrate aminotransferase-like enzyme